MNAELAMSQSLTCPQGHVWQLAHGDVEHQAKTACPVCGELATTSVNPTRIAETVEIAAAKVEVPGFELGQEFGRGGMGVVYKARQLNPERIVALKVMRRNVAMSDSSAARFRGESAAAARLEHPNIVRVYSVGETADNSYIALEFVDGPNLSALIAQDLPPQRDAAQLIATLARAVHFAHERHIIHRDLKPANVLIAPDGTPKLADFGLAKRLDVEMGETHTGEILGTVFYMAPEQAMGVTRNLGPACDVHALGVMLYELLSGRRPYVGQDVLETLTLVASAEPVAPRRLNPQISLDLETICLKCLEKLPRDRYASAAALADELDRVLRHEPIHARPAGSVEKAIKWSRRRPAAAVAIGAAVLIMLATVVGLVWHNRRIGEQLALTEQQRARAEFNLDKTQKKIDELLDEVTVGKFASLPASSGVRTKMLDWALQLCRQLQVQNAHDLHLRWQTARAERQVADIERLLNRTAAAEQAYAEAVRDLLQLNADYPRVKDFRRELATALNNQGLLRLTTGPTDEDRRNYEAAIVLWRELAAEQPDDAQYQSRLASSLSNLGLLLQAKRETKAADVSLREALALRKQLVDSGAGKSEQLADASSIAALAASEVNLGKLLYDEGRADEAQALFSTADARLSQLSAKQAAARDVRFAQIIAKHNLSVALAATGDQQHAEQTIAAALTLEDSVLAEFPQHPEAHSQRAQLEHTAADLLAKRQDVADALKHYRNAISSQLTAVELNNDNQQFRDRLRDHYQAGIKLTIGDGDPAIAAQLTDEYAKMYPGQPRDLIAAAALLAQCIPLAAEIKGGEKISAATLDHWRTQSLELVRSALAQGAKVEELPKSLTDALRASAEFKELISNAKK